MNWCCKIFRRPAALVFVCFFFCGLHSGVPVFAQPSLAATDNHNVTLEIGGEKTFVRVIRDAHQRNKWYYLLSIPRLYERERDGKARPDFKLIRYSQVSPQNTASFIEGGLLQFTVTFSLHGDLLPRLKYRVAQIDNVPEEKVRLDLLPIEDAKIHLFTEKGKFLKTSSLGTGIVITSGSRAASFLVELNKVGTDVLDSIVKSETGVPVLIEFKYTGLAPKRNYFVHVNWKNTIELVQTRKSVLKKLANLERFSASELMIALEELKSIFEQGSCIDFSTGSLAITSDELVTFYYPVLNVVKNRILESMPSKNIVGKEVDEKGRIKRHKWVILDTKLPKIRHLTLAQINSFKTIFDFNMNVLLQRNNIATGFIGIANYPVKIQKESITSVSTFFKSTYLLLPSVDENIGIDTMTCEVYLKNGMSEVRHHLQIAKWSGNTGWTQQNGQAVSHIAIPLLVASEGDVDIGQLSIKTELTIENGQDVNKVLADIKPTVGVDVYPFPSSSIAFFEIDGSLLPWLNITTVSDLKKIKSVKGEITGVYEDGTKVVSQIDMRPVLKNTHFEIPSIHVALFPKVNRNKMILSSVVPSLSGNFMDSASSIPWSNNGKDIYNDNIRIIKLFADEFHQ